MRDRLPLLLTCQHYELLAWDCQAPEHAQRIAEAAWCQLDVHLLTSTPGAAPVLPHLAKAFTAAFDAAVTRRIRRMAQTVQAHGNNTHRLHWRPRPVCLPWQNVLAQLPGRAPHGGAAQPWQAVRAEVISVLVAAAHQQLQRSILDYLQALTNLRQQMQQQSPAYAATTG